MVRTFSLKGFLVLLMLGLVGSGAAFLATGSGKKPMRQEQKKVVNVDQAEVVVDGFRYSRTEEGRGGWEVRAKKAEMKNYSGRAKLDDLDAVFRSKDGTVFTMSAGEGTFDKNTKDVNLSGKDGDIKIKSSNGYDMTVKDVHWDDKKKQLTTDDKVTIKGSHMSIEGKGLVAGTDLQEVRITNGVKTVFQPR